jgi:hypothetical protein
MQSAPNRRRSEATAIPPRPSSARQARCASTATAGSKLLLLLSLAACSSTTTPATGDAGQPDTGGCTFLCGDGGTNLPLAVQVRGKVDQICASTDGCHGVGAGMMALATGDEFQPMINVVSYEMSPMLRVRPGDPEQSYVYRKLACDGGIDGGCMPASTGYNADLARLFHDWIEAGAPTQ